MVPVYFYLAREPCFRHLGRHVDANLETMVRSTHAPFIKLYDDMNRIDRTIVGQTPRVGDNGILYHSMLASMWTDRHKAFLEYFTGPDASFLIDARPEEILYGYWARSDHAQWMYLDIDDQVDELKDCLDWLVDYAVGCPDRVGGGLDDRYANGEREFWADMGDQLGHIRDEFEEEIDKVLLRLEYAIGRAS